MHEHRLLRVLPKMKLSPCDQVTEALPVEPTFEVKFLLFR